MSREEFLTELRRTLQGKVSQQTINENIQYYEDYILAESHKGKTEAEVIAGLGDPRLLAKSIIDAENAVAKNTTDRKNKAEQWKKPGQSYGTDWQNRTSEEEFSYKKAKRRLWLILGAAFLIALLVVILIAQIMVFLLPVLLPVVIVFFLFVAMTMNKRF